MPNLERELSVLALLVLVSGIALSGNLLNRPTPSSPIFQAGPLTDAAYLLLADRVAANRTSFYVYQDADSGFNHGFPSGFFGLDSSDLNRIHLNTACVDDPGSASGCSADMNRLDRTHGNVLRISFDPLPAGHFAGINIQEPEGYVPVSCDPDPNCKGDDLSGAANVVLDIRSPTPGGIRVQFGIGGGVTSFFQIPQSSTYTTMIIPLSSLMPLPDLTRVHILFSVATNVTNAPNGGTVLLDNIRFEPVPTSQQSATGFPLGNQTFGVVPRTSPAPGRVPIPPDQLLRNLTTTYEAAITLQALLKRGTSQDLSGAQAIADAFVYALDHDIHGDPLPIAPDGSTGLHNGYESGDLALLNNQGPGQGLKGDIRLAGFTTSPAGNCGSSGFCLLLDGATGGNDAFAILALAAAYKQFNDVRYLNAAKKIGLWIAGKLTDTTGTGYGGYFVGYFDHDEFGHTPMELNSGKSVENNADIFAAFAVLGGIERGRGNISEANHWTNRANLAGDFVMQMFDSTNGRFNAGTVPAGTSPGPGVTPDPSTTRGNDVINTFDFLDSNSFTTLALAASPRYRNQIDWRRPVQYILSHFAQAILVGQNPFQGFNIVQAPTAGPNGIAWEFTGQAVAVMRFVDHLYHESNFGSSASFYFNQIQHAQGTAPFGDGRGLVASTVQNGDVLSPIEQCLSTPFQCIAERVGLAATTWVIFADQNINPLSSIGLETPGLYDPAHAAVFLRNSNTGGIADLAFTYGPGGLGLIPIPGDWDGNGVATIGLYDPAHAAFFLRNSNTGGVADVALTFGPSGLGWIPLAGDWNGDGIDTIGLYDPAHAAFFLRNSNTGGVADIAFTFGPAGLGWIPIVGDWNGDGVDTIGLHDPTHAAFFLRNSNTGGIADITFTYGPAGLGWIPIVGDWNGDGIDTIGLYDPVHAAFFLRHSNTGGVADISFTYGPAGMGFKPLVGDWDGL